MCPAMVFTELQLGYIEHVTVLSKSEFSFFQAPISAVGRNHL